MRRSLLRLEEALSMIRLGQLRLVQEEVGRSTHMDHKANTSKETTMDAVEVNALLDVIIKAKDSPGFAVISQAAHERLAEIIASLTPQPEEEEEKSAQWPTTQGESIERRV
jgi:hypothetical protein